jgi:hypothetical protein
MTTLINRRSNLRRLANTYGWTELAKRLGYRQPSFLVQMAGPNPTREVTEKSARRFEIDLGLPEGSLDVVATEVSPTDQIRALDAMVNQMPAVAPAQVAPVSMLVTPPVVVTTLPQMSDDDTARFVQDTIRAVSLTIGQQGVKLDKMKHLQIVNMAIGDAIDNGGRIDNGYIMNMVKLLK